jgi:hypothetical protein
MLSGAVVGAANKVRVRKGGNLLTRLATIRFPGKTLLYGFVYIVTHE